MSSSTGWTRINPGHYVKGTATIRQTEAGWVLTVAGKNYTRRTITECRDIHNRICKVHN